MSLTAADNQTGHGARVRGQINSTRWGTVISCTTLTPSPQRLLEQLHGYGVSVVHEMTVPHRVELIWPRTQALCPVRLSAAVKFISYRGIKAENAHFQPSAAGMDFRVADRLWADNRRNLSVQPWFRLRTLKTRTSRNGKISSKRQKNTPEVSHFYSFYWLNVKLSIF